MNSAEIVNKTANKAKYLSNKVSLDDVIETVDISRKILRNSKKELKQNNSNKQCNKRFYKNIKNRGILLKGTTRTITCQEGIFLNFLWH